jgi:hypothetical protein
MKACTRNQEDNDENLTRVSLGIRFVYKEVVYGWKQELVKKKIRGSVFCFM